MPKTLKNLMTAFAGESQANRRYIAFSQKALAESNIGLAKLFKAIAESETVHALSHLKIAGEVKSTIENLEAAIHGETHEFETLYPEFIDEAKIDGNEQALMSFIHAGKVEAIHARLLKEAHEKLKLGETVDITNYFVCSVCGNLEIGMPPDKCPICKSPVEKFFEVH